MMPRLRLAVLVSGRGSNLANLLAASRDGRLDADVVLVASNRADAPALQLARQAGVPTQTVESKGLPREEHEAKLVPLLDAARPDLVVLAGYMRILSGAFIRHHEGRLVNIHPSLLPAFPGMDAQAQAHAAGARIAGCTVHFVNEQVDAGPILAQAAVALAPGLSPDEVRARILEAEHLLYPRALQLLATGRARWDAGRVVFAPGTRAPSAVLLSPEVDA